MKEILMAKKLTKEALLFLKSDPDTFNEVAHDMGLTPDSLITLVRKDSKSLNTYDGVLIIAKAMGKKPEQILIKVKSPTKSKKK